MATSHLDETTKIYQVPMVELWHGDKAYREQFIAACEADAARCCYGAWVIQSRSRKVLYTGGAAHE